MATTELELNKAGAAMVEKVVVGGDLAKLSNVERLNYYARICQSLGLNPLTRPFQYIFLNGKLTLYAGAGCTDQLRGLKHVSIDKIEDRTEDGVYVVKVYASTPDGRQDAATGVVAIDGLRGETKANAMMKCETKAKRRVTLSICGLGMMDESEVGPGFRLPDETQVTGITEAVKADVDLETGELKEGTPPDEEPLNVEEERARLLANYMGTAATLKLKAPKRAELWTTHCGRATAENVDPAALKDLIKAVEALATVVGAQ
jgi:hypothetical protein